MTSSFGRLPSLKPPDQYDRNDSLNDIEEDRLFISGVENAKTGRKNYINNAKRRKALIIVGSVLGGLGILALIIGLAYGLRKRPIDYACPAEAASSTFTFFIIGDWGRQGAYTQETTAKMMSQTGGCWKPKFVISTGDNFYPSGLSSAMDSQWYLSFINMYKDDSLQVPWYSVLGNHDYGDTLSSVTLSSCPRPSDNSLQGCQGSCCHSPLWQSNLNNSAIPDKRWQLQQGTWKQSFLNGTLDIIFVDTSPFIIKYQSTPMSNLIGGVSSVDTAGQTTLIEALLKSSGAKYRVVVGHHPIRSYGHHCQDPNQSDCADMSWLRLLLTKYKVPLYLCGHDHDLQFIKLADDPIYYVISGAGSDVRANEFDDVNTPEGSMNFHADDQGFVVGSLNPDGIKLYYYTSHSSLPTYSVTVPPLQ
mmetsp:Transcript_12110/g.26026  ORF Transcript_12110/g.26026 Transcript_12110/m.26026 type:complete len:418 (+) Transcript_12110:115-1368(+)